MGEAKVRMCHTCLVLLVFSLVSQCFALNCRSEGGPKDDELKTIYRNCLRKQEGQNITITRGYTDDDWRDSKGHSQRSPWDRDSKLGRDDRMRDERRDDSYRDDRMSRDDMYQDRMNYDRMGSNFDRMDRNDRMNNRDDKMGSNDRMSGRNDMMGNRNNGYGRTQLSGRDDFPQSEDFGEDMTPVPYNYRSSTQPPRRYKREKRVGTNSGQRSQYNPNNNRRPSYDDDSYRSNDRSNSSNSSKNADLQACAMHCFLENMEMTGDNGMPDRYLVTHAITKDVKNEDLRDFLQESIEECFQILDNENTEDKCEFSKNLLLCLSEKGRANCDDWKDNIQF